MFWKRKQISTAQNPPNASPAQLIIVQDENIQADLFVIKIAVLALMAASFVIIKKINER